MLSSSIAIWASVSLKVLFPSRESSPLPPALRSARRHSATTQWHQSVAQRHDGHGVPAKKRDVETNIPIPLIALISYFRRFIRDCSTSVHDCDLVVLGAEHPSDAMCMTNSCLVGNQMFCSITLAASACQGPTKRFWIPTRLSQHMILWHTV